MNGTQTNDSTGGPPLPLQGVRVLAISQFGAGPYAMMNLGDLGAEIIKIEDPTTKGDVSRSVPPYCVDGDSLYFQSFNRNNRSITINLRKPEGVALLRRLVAVSDAVFDNLRGGQAARLGLRYAALAALNPRIVCCSLNAFGSEGQRAHEPGYDYLMQAYAGYMSMTGDPSGPPSSCGVSIIDHAAGIAAGLGIVSALYSAARTGLGRDVEVSLFDTAYSMLTYLATWNLKQGFQPQRYPGSAHQSLVPVGTFRTADGYITLFCGKDKFWKLLCAAMGDDELAEDSRFGTPQARQENREQLIEAVQSHLLTRTTGEWLGALRGKVPCAPVRSLTEALADPELRRRGTVFAVDHPVFGEVPQVGTPVRFSGAQMRHRRAPALGEDTTQVLREYLQCTEQEIAELRRIEAI